MPSPTAIKARWFLFDDSEKGFLKELLNDYIVRNGDDDSYTPTVNRLYAEIVTSEHIEEIARGDN